MGGVLSWFPGMGCSSNVLARKGVRFEESAMWRCFALQWDHGLPPCCLILQLQRNRVDDFVEKQSLGVVVAAADFEVVADK